MTCTCTREFYHSTGWEGEVCETCLEADRIEGQFLSYWESEEAYLEYLNGPDQNGPSGPNNSPFGAKEVA